MTIRQAIQATWHGIRYFVQMCRETNARESEITAICVKHAKETRRIDRRNAEIGLDGFLAEEYPDDWYDDD